MTLFEGRINNNHAIEAIDHGGKVHLAGRDLELREVGVWPLPGGRMVKRLGMPAHGLPLRAHSP